MRLEAVTVLLQILFNLGQAPQACPRLGERELRIGSPDAPNYSLTQVPAIAILSGMLYVAQPMEQLIRVFDSKGRFLKNIGRRGRGPGEFLQPRLAGTHSGRLWVFDGTLGTTTFMDSTGIVERTVASSLARVRDPTVSVHGLIPFRDGKYFVIWRNPAEPLARSGVNTSPVIVVAADGEPIAGMPRIIASGQPVIRLTAKDGTPLFFTNPLNDDPLILPALDEDVILIIQRSRPMTRHPQAYSILY